ncbi:hypothetical protein [Acidipropionibacterium acidipropionici]|uniref:hypothetical protein n=1 Tax=Acidipropionibacterium acidipropionici TaxID=1748 RepID=UPI00190F2E66|nr:hypothetical protein [Acidipropionibacterium acidipropionici]
MKGFRYLSMVAADMERSSVSTAGVARRVTFPNSLKRSSLFRVSSITGARYFPEG